MIPPEGGKLREREEGNERVLEVYDQVCALDPDLEAEATAAIPFLITIGWPDEARLRARYLNACLGFAALPRRKPFSIRWRVVGDLESYPEENLSE
ncbi:hypothetical protein [Microbispora bryophytorum]|uniref:hypothetical protein n=1 Tax=Microbispora bryophytorum TaxID=1460882 RepID=UPI00340EACE0